MKNVLIHKLENLVSEYKRIMQGQVNLEKLTYYAVTYHSTAIEGSTLTEGQVYNLLADGNGRTSRLLMNYILALYEFPT